MFFCLKYKAIKTVHSDSEKKIQCDSDTLTSSLKPLLTRNSLFRSEEISLEFLTSHFSFLKIK